MIQPTKWLTRLVSEVSKFMLCLDGNAPVQCHLYHNEDDRDEWEITVFGEPNRFGGRLAKHSIDRCFSVDVLGVVMLFEDVESCQWQTSNIDASDELGPHLSVCGRFEGHQVWLRVLSRAPERLRGNVEVKSQSRVKDD